MLVRLRPRCTGAESAGGKSAVDDHTVAGHKRRLIRTHPENGFGHFLDPTDAPDGMKSGKIILFHIHAIGEPIDHLSVDHGRIDRVDANPLRGVFQSGAFRESDDRMFGRSIDPNSREPDYARDRRAVYDGAAALLQHPRDLVLHGKPDAFDINIHHRVEVGFSLLGEWPRVALNTGVVESDIEPAIRRYRVVDQCLDISCDHNIRPPKTRRPTGVTDHRDRFLHALHVAITDYDFRPFASKGDRRRAADSGTSACYQCNFAVKFFHEMLILFPKCYDRIVSDAVEPMAAGFYPDCPVLLIPFLRLRLRGLNLNTPVLS